MKIRQITSLSAFTSFVLMLITSLILYISPQGRVAYWADWRLLGLDKTQWSNLHINLGVLFLLAVFLHIYYNWKPILSYLKNKARELKIFTPQFNTALILCLLVSAGALLSVPPFSWIIQGGDYFKAAASRKYGEPPYGHAELSSLASFTKRVGMDVEDAMARLGAAGIRVEGERRQILDIAKENDLSPQELYRLMQPESASESKNGGLPALPTAGLGRRTLTEIAADYNLDMNLLVQGLAERNIEAGPDTPFKEIAEANGMSPMDVYQALREAAGPG